MFGSQDVQYLGFIVTPSNVAINPHETKAIEDWPTPTSKKDMLSFFSRVNYYRRSIKNCSGIAKPLTELTMNVLFVPSKNDQDAFKNLLQKVTTAPSTAHISTRLSRHSSHRCIKNAIGAVLEQDGPDGRFHFTHLERGGRELCRTRPRTPSYRGHIKSVEMLPTWTQFNHTHRSQFVEVLETQHHLLSRQVRWLERLVWFDFTAISLKRKSNHVADALYRQPKDIPKNTEYSRDLLENVLQKTFETNAISIGIADPSIVKKLVNEYAQDSELENVYRNPADLFTGKTSSFTGKTIFTCREDSLD